MDQVNQAVTNIHAFSNLYKLQQTLVTIYFNILDKYILLQELCRILKYFDIKEAEYKQVKRSAKM